MQRAAALSAAVRHSHCGQRDSCQLLAVALPGVSQGRRMVLVLEIADQMDSRSLLDCHLYFAQTGSCPAVAVVLGLRD